MSDTEKLAKVRAVVDAYEADLRAGLNRPYSAIGKIKDVIGSPWLASPPEPVSAPPTTFDKLPRYSSGVYGPEQIDRDDEGEYLHRAEVLALATYYAPLSAAAPSGASDAPMQPLVIAADGRVRFKENRIVSALLEHSRKHGYGLNETARGDFTPEEHMQVAQLIGYSLDGYGTLSYVTDESYDRAALAHPSEAPTKEQP